jgi:hypothetical protein
MRSSESAVVKRRTAPSDRLTVSALHPAESSQQLPQPRARHKADFTRLCGRGGPGAVFEGGGPFGLPGGRPAMPPSPAHASRDQEGGPRGETPRPTVRHRWSYCRIVPGAADSGRQAPASHQQRRHRYLKLAFSHAAVRAVQYVPEVRQWCQQWRRQTPVKVARALVAKALAKCVSVVLRAGVDFTHDFPGTPLTKRKQVSWPRRASPSALTASPR